MTYSKNYYRSTNYKSYLQYTKLLEEIAHYLSNSTATILVKRTQSLGISARNGRSETTTEWILPFYGSCRVPEVYGSRVVVVVVMTL